MPFDIRMGWSPRSCSAIKERAPFLIMLREERIDPCRCVFGVAVLSFGQCLRSVARPRARLGMRRSVQKPQLLRRHHGDDQKQSTKCAEGAGAAGYLVGEMTRVVAHDGE